MLGLNKAQVGAVATFYTMYKRKPTGDYLVSVCTNTMCDVLGGQEVYDTLSEHLGVGHDETTADGKITLEHAECLAACDYGPVMTVNYDFFDRVDPAAALGRGRRAARRRAADADPRRPALHAQGDGGAARRLRRRARRRGRRRRPGEPTLRGLRLAEQHGISVPGFDPKTPIRSKAEADGPRRRRRGRGRLRAEPRAVEAAEAAPAAPHRT